MEPLLPILGGLSWLVSTLVFLGLGFLVYLHLVSPASRHERACLLADLLETELNHGHSLESALESLGAIPDARLRKRFQGLHRLRKAGTRWRDAVASSWRTGGRLGAFLEAGCAIADVPRLLRCFRRLPVDTQGSSLTLQNYLYSLIFFSGPVGVGIIALLNIYVMPKYREIFVDMLESQQAPHFPLMDDVLPVLLPITVVLTLLVAWICGTGLVSSWSPKLAGNLFARLIDGTPWSRKRALRDFSVVLADLLDEGIPEEQAVEIASGCTDSRRLVKRAKQVLENLRGGQSLDVALGVIDPKGRLHWHLRAATQPQTTLSESIKGLAENLDAQAFREEQVVVQLLTTGFVLWNGLIVFLVSFGALTPIWQLIYNLATW